MWTVNEQVHNYLRQILSTAVQADSQQQNQLAQAVHEMRTMPDFCNYLVMILCSKEEQLVVRSTAGLILKNQIKSYWTRLDSSVHEVICTNVINCLVDTDALIRNIAGTIITTTLVAGGLNSWPGVLQKLLELIYSGNEIVAASAFSAMSKICEDSYAELCRDEAKPLNFLVPKFMHILEEDNGKLSFFALRSLIPFIAVQTEVIEANLAKFVGILARKASAEGTIEMKSLIVRALTDIADSYMDKLGDAITSIMEYMLQMLASGPEDIKLDAAEFWLALSEKEAINNVMEKISPRLIPILLQGMVYSEDDVDLLDEEDDKEDDNIKPQHHKARIHNEQNEEKKSENQEDEDEEDADEDDEATSDWNLRRCSAATLDVLSSSIPENILVDSLLPLVQNYISSGNWKHKECAILALGAIAEGCYDSMSAHLSSLVPFLAENTKHSKALVRSIACWTLSRYSNWLVSQAINGDSKYVELILRSLLECVLDNHKKVQASACSAVAALFEEGGMQLMPCLSSTIQAYSMAFQKYKVCGFLMGQYKNILVLLDCCGRVADAMGTSFASSPDPVKILLQCVMNQWERIKDDSHDLFSLFECLTSLCIGVEGLIAPYSAVIYKRCLNIIITSQQPSSEYDEVDKDFCISSLDLIAALIHALNTSSKELIDHIQPPLLAVICQCLKDPVPEVRQSVFALIGDMCSRCFPVLEEKLNDIIKDVFLNADPKNPNVSVSVANNAIWALGEISIRKSETVKPFIPEIVSKIVEVLMRNQLSQRHLLENIAVCIGRLALISPNDVVQYIPHILPIWCKWINHVRDEYEKETSFKGLIKAISLNPQSVNQNLPFLLDSIVQYQEPPAEMKNIFASFISNFKGLIGENWGAFSASLPNELRSKLHSLYQID